VRFPKSFPPPLGRKSFFEPHTPDKCKRKQSFPLSQHLEQRAGFFLFPLFSLVVLTANLFPYNPALIVWVRCHPLLILGVNPPWNFRYQNLHQPTRFISLPTTFFLKLPPSSLFSSIHFSPLYTFNITVSRTEIVVPGTAPCFMMMFHFPPETASLRSFSPGGHKLSIPKFSFSLPALSLCLFYSGFFRCNEFFRSPF